MNPAKRPYFFNHLFKVAKLICNNSQDKVIILSLSLDHIYCSYNSIFPANFYKVVIHLRVWNDSSLKERILCFDKSIPLIIKELAWVYKYPLYFIITFAVCSIVVF